MECNKSRLKNNVTIVLHTSIELNRTIIHNSRFLFPSIFCLSIITSCVVMAIVFDFPRILPTQPTFIRSWEPQQHPSHHEASPPILHPHHRLSPSPPPLSHHTPRQQPSRTKTRLVPHPSRRCLERLPRPSQECLHKAFEGGDGRNGRFDLGIVQWWKWCGH